MDSLKIQSSILSPKTDSDIKLTVTKMVDLIYSEYGNFIPEISRQRTKGIEDRVLITTSHAFLTMWKDWDSTTRGTQAKITSGTLATLFVEGMLMGFDNPNQLWKIYAHEVQKELIKSTGSIKEAKQIVSQTIYSQITHEVVHQFQDFTLPLPFLEIATRWYERMISRKLKFSYPLNELDEERVYVYQAMVIAFGDKLHRTFFGTQQSPEIKQEVLGWMRPELTKKLFPGRRGL